MIGGTRIAPFVGRERRLLRSHPMSRNRRRSSDVVHSDRVTPGSLTRWRGTGCRSSACVQSTTGAKLEVYGDTLEIDGQTFLLRNKDHVGQKRAKDAILVG